MSLRCVLHVVWNSRLFVCVCDHVVCDRIACDNVARERVYLTRLCVRVCERSLRVKEFTWQGCVWKVCVCVWKRSVCVTMLCERVYVTRLCVKEMSVTELWCVKELCVTMLRADMLHLAELGAKWRGCKDMNSIRSLRTKCSWWLTETYIIVEMKPYCSEQANEATRTFSIGAIATAEDLRMGHWAICPQPFDCWMSPVSQHHFVIRHTLFCCSCCIKVMVELAWKTVTSTGVTHPISACWLDKSGYSTALSKQCQKYWPLISNLPNDDRNGKSVVLKRGWGVLYDLALNATCNPKPETLCQPFWSASFDKCGKMGSSALSLVPGSSLPAHAVELEGFSCLALPTCFKNSGL